MIATQPAIMTTPPVTFKTIKQPEITRWNDFVMQHADAHILQLSEWGKLKSQFGWTAEIVAVTATGATSPESIVAGALILYRRLPFRMGMRAYIPAGPLFYQANADPTLPANKLLWQVIDESARAHHTVYMKVEPCDWYRPRPDLRENLLAAGLHPGAQIEQPPRTVVLDIGDSEDAILKRMNQSTRYKSKLKEKKEIDVRQGTKEDLESFTDLMKITGERDSFGIYKPEYYRSVFELFHQAPDSEAGHSGCDCALFLASYKGQDLAGVMVLYCGKNAYYLYGGSSNVERNRMPTYILQWEAIQWAKRHGAIRYDMWGIPDADEATLEAEFENRHDGLWGVYGFKRGFGGRVVRSVGVWDRVYNPILYNIYHSQSLHRVYRLYSERRRDPALRTRRAAPAEGTEQSHE